MSKLTCFGCKKHPSELDEYIEAVEGTEETPDEYVRSEEGTLNQETGDFLCTMCYIKAGMPSSPTGWVVPTRGNHDD